MAEAERTPRAPRGAGALAFAVAALLSSWNPVAAPFGLAVGLAAAILALRALRRTERRRLPAAAIAVGAVAVLASVVVLLRTAGALGVDLSGEPVVKGRTPAELDEVLTRAGERTKAQRARAAEELERVTGTPARDGGPAAAPGRRPGGAPDGGAGAR
ncbi:MAG: hypothetical protein ACJ79L_01775 [Anaeromyxobacteraceae bacterium]